MIAIGPGLGRHIETAELVRDVALNTTVPTVIDADGLNAFEGLAKYAERAETNLGSDSASRRDGEADRNVA